MFVETILAHAGGSCGETWDDIITYYQPAAKSRRFMLIIITRLSKSRRNLDPAMKGPA